MNPGYPARPALWTGLLLLFVTALIHYHDTPGKLRETPTLGYAYILLVGGCCAAAAWLLSDRWRWGYLLGLLVCAGAVIAYALTRTVTLFGSPKDDIGNWAELGGIISLAVEIGFVVLAITQLRRPARSALG